MLSEAIARVCSREIARLFGVPTHHFGSHEPLMSSRLWLVGPGNEVWTVDVMCSNGG
jgi:hypothetical protein